MLNDGGCPHGALQDDGGTKQASADVGGLYSSAAAHLYLNTVIVHICLSDHTSILK